MMSKIVWLCLLIHLGKKNNECPKPSLYMFLWKINNFYFIRKHILNIVAQKYIIAMIND